MVNAVIDTNVFVSGLLSAYGNPAKIINAFKEKHFNLFYSAGILEEYRDVLFRGKLGLDPKDIDDLLGEISKIGFSVIPEMSDITLLDEDDRIFYDTAKAVNAYLITGNEKHFPSDPLVIPPVDFVESILLTK